MSKEEYFPELCAPEFVGFQKLPRLSRECIITEKIDGTNGQIYITDDGRVFAGSRNRWLLPGNSDNAGFAGWVKAHEEELRVGLGPGRHFGEWWGQGIGRKYGLAEKRFSLFNVDRWGESRPECCHVVPVLYRGIFKTEIVENIITILRTYGSFAVNGFINPEGVVIWHIAANMGFKKTLEKDESPKGMVSNE